MGVVVICLLVVWHFWPSWGNVNITDDGKHPPIDIIYSIYWRPEAPHMKDEELANLAFYAIVGINPAHPEIRHQFYFVYDNYTADGEEIPNPEITARDQIAAYLREEPFASRFSGPNVDIVFAPNDARDFCNFYRGIKSNTTRPGSYMLFMNTSVRGPFVHIPALEALEGRWTQIYLAMFNKDPQVRAVAVTWDCLNSIHFYSFAFMLDAKGVALAKYHWKEACQIREIQENVDKFEVDFPHEITRIGGKYGVLLEEDYLLPTEHCGTESPYQPNSFSRFKDSIYPTDTIFYKAGGTAGSMHNRSPHQLKRLSMHSVFQVDWALKMRPLRGSIRANFINIKFPALAEWNNPHAP